MASSNSDEDIVPGYGGRAVPWDLYLPEMNALGLQIPSTVALRSIHRYHGNGFGGCFENYPLYSGGAFAELAQLLDDSARTHLWRSFRH